MTHCTLPQRFACPNCRGDLRAEKNLIVCTECERTFRFIDGIPSLLPDAPEPTPEPQTPQLSVLIMARNEGANLGGLLSDMNEVLADLQLDFELIVIDGNSTDDTVEVAEAHGASVSVQEKPGYGNAFREGLRRCRGHYVLTFDADGSHDPNYLRVLWSHRDQAELVVGSRYVARGEAWMPLLRSFLSPLLNIFVTTILGIPLKDVTSGFRLYKRSAIETIELRGKDFNVLIELLVKIVLEGYRVIEVPFLYKPRWEGVSKASLARFAVSYVRSAVSLWRLRRTISVADYDCRAYHSMIMPQRYWQRARYRIITRFLDGTNSNILDVGCGSSKIIQSLPGAVGADVLIRKLRYLRLTNPLLVQASVFALPFKDNSFDCVVCSQVIEHIPNTEDAVSELLRVLRPGGRFILGTPDFGNWQWPLIERIYERVMPGGYAEEHINPLTRDDVVAMVDRLGADYLEEDFILKAEWVGLFRKRDSLNSD